MVLVNPAEESRRGICIVMVPNVEGSKNGSAETGGNRKAGRRVKVGRRLGAMSRFIIWEAWTP